MTNASRRQVLASLWMLAPPFLPAWAQGYPMRPVRLVTSFAPGGNADILARILSDGLSRRMGQPFIVDNRPGGSNIIGTQFVAKSPPDGYTLLITSSSHGVNPTIFGKDLPYDTQKDFTGVAKLALTPMVLVANPGLGITTLKELIAKAKSQPGVINFASSGNASPAHMAGELLNAMAGIKLTHIPYKGTAQGVTDAMSGQVQLAFPSLSSVGSSISSGKLIALGITSDKRSAVAPEIPTIAETVAGFEASIWTAVIAPAGVPRAIVNQLNTEIDQVLRSPDVTQKLLKMGVDATYGPPEALDAFIEAEIKKWAGILKYGNLKI